MNSRFIIIRLVGGLGNQLFQLQYGLNLRREIGGQVQVDDSFFTKSSKTHETMAIAPLIGSMPRVRLGWFDLRVKRLIERTCHKFCIKVPSWGRPEFFFENSKADVCAMPMVIIDGFWQKVNYLNDDFVQNVRSQLQLHSVAHADNDCVGVHVRRGDYLTNKHWFIKQQTVTPMSYYKAAFSHFRGVLGTPRFEIYTDDEPWAVDAFDHMSNVLVIPSASLKPLDLLARMACYRNYIITNSTLSWWAAVLSSAEDKKVVLPKRWGKGMTSERYRLPDWMAL